MRNLLIVIDMQNDFIDGALGTDDAKRIIGNVANKIRKYSPEDIFATRDTHNEGYLDSREGSFLPVEHCMEGSEGWQVHPDIQELLTGVRYYDKNGFASVEMAEDICEIASKEDISIEIVGLCTDICVIVNALHLKAHLPEVDITVDAACCAGATPQKHSCALDVLRSCQITVING